MFTRSPSRGSRSGQAIVFLIMVVVILFFVVLWNFDLHKILRVKLMSQNAGDAGALVAARWQGTTLNLLGDLNLMHVLALSVGDPVAEESITNIQARLCFVGPMIGFMASQQAAKQNRAYQNEDFTALLAEHARVVRTDYPSSTTPGGPMLFPEPYEGAWPEYADMLDLIAADGVAAGPDNARYFTDIMYGDHILLIPDFYDAIAGRTWCWFHHHAPTLLVDYANFFPCWWPPLPAIPSGDYINSEFFGLGMARVETAFSAFTDLDTARQMATDRGLSANMNITGMITRATWYCYGDAWSAWDAMSPSGAFPFPGTGTVRPQFDYAGADAAVRIEAPVARLTPTGGGGAATNDITWTAAAKPFGFLGEPEDPEKPNSCGVVLPAFHDVRLIPIDASSAPAAGSYNLEWRRHVEIHLPEYMVTGPPPYACYYCRQLQTWEDPLFRQEGVDWLSTNSVLCDVSGGGGGGGGGGRRRGH